MRVKKRRMPGMLYIIVSLILWILVNKGYRL